MSDNTKGMLVLIGIILGLVMLFALLIGLDGAIWSLRIYIALKISEIFGVVTPP